jgi:hypothetical protein
MGSAAALAFFGAAVSVRTSGGLAPCGRDRRTSDRARNPESRSDVTKAPMLSEGGQIAQRSGDVAVAC